MPQTLLEQVPAECVALPPGQTLPHPPQLLGSLARVRQVPLQQRCPDPQAALPPHLQVAPSHRSALTLLQGVLHVPQALKSVSSERHVPLQQV